MHRPCREPSFGTLRSSNWSLVDGRVKLPIFPEARYPRAGREHPIRAGGRKWELSTAERRGGQPELAQAGIEPKLSSVT
jgi:hypothetical protein